MTFHPGKWGQRRGTKLRASTVETSTPHACEHCGQPYDPNPRKGVPPKRFCSEPCRKAAESKRRRDRREGVITAPEGAKRTAARNRHFDSIKEAKSC